MSAIPIWEPKYKTNCVLVACSKVGMGETKIFFCYDKKYLNLYSFDGEKAHKEYNIVFNSKIWCYAVPLDELRDLGTLPPEYQEIKEEEIRKYKLKMLR